MMARALGGTIVTNPERTKLRTIPLTLTDAALQDPMFDSYTTPLLVQQKHQNINNPE